MVVITGRVHTAAAPSTGSQRGNRSNEPHKPEGHKLHEEVHPRWPRRRGNVTGGPNSEWELTASTDTLGQVGASAEGTFIGIPNCAVDAVVPVGNHGEYVSGAAHVGIKGKALAEIAKNVTLVGPYKG